MNKIVGRSSFALDAKGDDNFKLTLFPDAGGCVEAEVSLREVQTAIKAHLDRIIPTADITRLLERMSVLQPGAAGGPGGSSGPEL